MTRVPRTYPENEILVALYRSRQRQLSVKALVEATGRSEATIRRHLSNMRWNHPIPWVVRVEGRPATYLLTPKGLEVAYWRARRRR